MIWQYKNRKLIMKFMVYLFYIAIISISIFLYTTVYKSNNDNIKFKILYTGEEQKVKEDIKYTIQCLLKSSNASEKSECMKYKYSIPSYTKLPYKNVYRNYKGGYDALVQPIFKSNIEVIVGIPCAPLFIDGRIAARRTYMNDKKIDGYNALYIFFTGLVPEKLYKYDFLLLKKESQMFHDIVIFNMINTYYNITLLLMSMHKWIISNYPFIKYFIRWNLDAVFIPNNIKGLLHKNYDVIAQMSHYPKRKVYYPQGFFYIFSKRAADYMYKMSFKRKLYRADDLIYGEMIALNKSLIICDISKQSEYNCNFCTMMFNKSFISLHGFVYSPAIIEIIYNFSTKNLYSYELMIK